MYLNVSNEPNVCATSWQSAKLTDYVNSITLVSSLWRFCRCPGSLVDYLHVESPRPRGGWTAIVSPDMCSIHGYRGNGLLSPQDNDWKNTTVAAGKLFYCPLGSLPFNGIPIHFGKRVGTQWIDVILLARNYAGKNGQGVTDTTHQFKFRLILLHLCNNYQRTRNSCGYMHVTAGLMLCSLTTRVSIW